MIPVGKFPADDNAVPRIEGETDVLEGIPAIARKIDLRIACDKHPAGVVVVRKEGEDLVVGQGIVRQRLPARAAVRALDRRRHVARIRQAVADEGIARESHRRSVPALHAREVHRLVRRAEIRRMVEAAHVAADVDLVLVGRIDRRGIEGSASADAAARPCQRCVRRHFPQRENQCEQGGYDCERRTRGIRGHGRLLSLCGVSLCGRRTCVRVESMSMTRYHSCRPPSLFTFPPFESGGVGMIFRGDSPGSVWK